jgi:hypothetical protein
MGNGGLREGRPACVGIGMRQAPAGSRLAPTDRHRGALASQGVTRPSGHHTIHAMKPGLASNVTISPEVLFQEVGGEAVLLDLASETYFGLDDVGTRIWQLLQEHGELMAIRDRMLEEYDVEAARLEEDLLNHIEQLAEAGLVIIEAGDHASTP